MVNVLVQFNPDKSITREIYVSPEIFAQLAAHGAKQKANDAHAQDCPEIEDKLAAWNEVLDNLERGIWGTVRSGNPVETEAKALLLAHVKAKGLKGKDAAAKAKALWDVPETREKAIAKAKVIIESRKAAFDDLPEAGI